MFRYAGYTPMKLQNPECFKSKSISPAPTEVSPSDSNFPTGTGTGTSVNAKPVAAEPESPSKRRFSFWSVLGKEYSYQEILTENILNDNDEIPTASSSPRFRKFSGWACQSLDHVDPDYYNQLYRS